MVASGIRPGKEGIPSVSFFYLKLTGTNSNKNYNWNYI